MRPGPICHFLEATALPGDTEWLGPSERSRFAGLTHPKRRLDWLAGRWAVKQAAILAPGFGPAIDDPSRLEILPDPGGAPRAYVDGVRLSLALSLSHRQGAALAVVSATGRVGCDLEWIEARSDAFIEDYFGPAEQRTIAAAGPEGRELLANGLWSAKESLAKLLGLGLRIDTRDLEIEAFPVGDGIRWRPTAARYGADGRRFSGWWRSHENWILTVFTEPKADRPRELQTARGRGRVPAS
jgi:4'-phosphopantetheinyl transferase